MEETAFDRQPPNGDESRPLIARRTRRWEQTPWALGVALLLVTLERTVFYYFFLDVATHFNYNNHSCNPRQDTNLTEQPDIGRPSTQIQYELTRSLSYLLPVLGGLLGDGVLGRFSTLLLGSVVYLLATVCFLILISVSEARGSRWFESRFSLACRYPMRAPWDFTSAA